MSSRVRLVAYGTVQGVGFRFFVVNAAMDAGVEAGWVRNREDGAVELEAEGTAESIARLREAVRRGPPWSEVERVEEEPGSDDPLPRPFMVRR